MKIYNNLDNEDINDIQIPITIKEALNYNVNIKNNIEYFALDILKI
jgi:hypothetical protein